MTAPAVVVICACGHAERMHERDDGNRDGRGNCFRAGCGCAEFRVDSAEPPVEPAGPAEVVQEPVKPLPPVATSLEVVPSLTYQCPLCDRSFSTGQGLIVHKGRSHKAEPDYAAIAAQIDAEKAAASDAADEPDPVPEPAAPVSAPAPNSGFAASIIDSRDISVTIDAGTLGLTYTVDWLKLPGHSRAGLYDLIAAIHQLAGIDMWAVSLDQDDTEVG